ncbi:Flagellum attachment zone protein 2 [Trypanosoma cruzi]|uniref:Flagellum attachment zone protein 2 n=1 Tax=Trypanosoma cruzi TaxID=5693 RepID=Q9GZ32_TRYCR|nr:unknown [Trypanosoma cruzi]PWV12583.1 Flagellum attachment zone protein 2 [Trypanosoma cruzi]
MQEDYPVNLRVEMTPDGSSVVLPGSITITRTTVSVFKLCEASDEEPLFVGVCSVPLIRFARVPSTVLTSADSLVLTGASGHLFINAALSAGIAPAKDGSVVSARTASTSLFPGSSREEPTGDELQRLDNPARWGNLRLDFPSDEDCDRCVEALLARHAEDITAEYMRSTRLAGNKTQTADKISKKILSVRAADESIASNRSTNQRSRNTQDYTVTKGDLSEFMQSCRSSPMDLESPRGDSYLVQASKIPASRPSESFKELGTPQSELRTPHESQHGRILPNRSHPTASQRELPTPHASLNGSNFMQGSQNAKGLPVRSNPTNSRRELGTPSELRTPHESQHGRILPNRSHPTASQREPPTPHASLNGSNFMQGSQNAKGLPVRSNPTNSRRELGTPSELRTPQGSRIDSVRELPPDAVLMPKSLNNNSVYAKTPHSTSSLRTGDDFGRTRHPGSVGRPTSLGPNAVPSTPGSSHAMHVAPASGQNDDPVGKFPYQSPSDLTVTQRSSRARTEHQRFLRNVMKFMHHRLHLMQYLHKELVHEAYLVEEAKLFGGRGRGSRSASMSRSLSHSISRPTSVSPRSSRRAALSTIAEESSRLREIEARLRSVEKLQREAEQDRQEALRLRNEAEKKLEAASQELANAPRHSFSSRNMMEPQKNDIPVRSQSPILRGGQQHPLQKNDSTDVLHAPYPEKHRGSELSRMSRPSTVLTGSGQLAFASSQQLHHFQPAGALTEVEYSNTILDRYIYGDEWHLLYPAREEDVRFCALIDTCLILKLPRRLVTITNVSLDQPGMRITAEIHHSRDHLPRETIERRFTTQPFLFLKRLYEIRHCFPESPAALGQFYRGNRHGSRGTSRAVTPRGNHTNSLSYLRVADEEMDSVEDGEITTEGSMTGMNGRMRELERITQERVQQREQERIRERERKQKFFQQERLRQQLGQLERDEDSRRSRIVLSEAQERQDAGCKTDWNHKKPIAVSQNALEVEEQVQRAEVEAGYARQLQVLARAQNRNFTFVRMFTQERERRWRVADQEREDRLVLDLMMNPRVLVGVSSQTEVDERCCRQRLIEAEAKQRRQIYANMRSFLIDVLQDRVEAIVGDERTARMILAADEMKEWLDIVCKGKTPTSGGVPRAAFFSPQAWQALFAEEVAERTHLFSDEERRRRLFRREFIFTTEDAARNEIELKELDEHVFMLESIMHCNRAMLERRRQERKDMTNLSNEEQYYRKGVLSEEQDEWEVLVELFDSGLNDVLVEEAARLAAEAAMADLESPQRRRRVTGTPRQAKPFHYMTFVPEDMDHPPSANLAIEGILGCSINKNLEVTSIERPLPRVEEDDLQFQAGDMILDVAGYSLHSLSHLREVLSNRTMQIQHEAREEFVDLPEEELTVNPALQKYVDVLCEHHNFLVQVLRGCDIFQIIVKS